MAGGVSNSFVQRVIGAMALDAAIYEEVEADPRAMGQAFTIVALSALAGGIGARGVSVASAGSVAFISVVLLLAWAAWALVVYHIGGRVLPAPETRVNIGEVMRTLGFAASPGLFRVLGVFPGVAGPVFAVTWVWMLLAMVVAVRQALDFRSTARAVTVCVLGWLLAIAIAALVGLVFGPTVS
jgi:hypothetical protein